MTWAKIWSWAAGIVVTCRYASRRTQICARTWGRRVVWRLPDSYGDGIVCESSPGRARTVALSRDIEYIGSAHDEAKCAVLKAAAAADGGQARLPRSWSQPFGEGCNSGGEDHRRRCIAGACYVC